MQFSVSYFLVHNILCLFMAAPSNAHTTLLTGADHRLVSASIFFRHKIRW